MNHNEHAETLDARGSIGAPRVRVERGETAEEDRNETDDEGKVIGIRRGHRVGILGRYYARGEITSRQHDAGQLFVHDWEMTNRLQRQVADVDAVHGGGADPAVAMHKLAHLRIDARRRHDAAVRVLGPCYPLVADVLLAHGSPTSWMQRRGYPIDGGKAVLQLALDALAEHYAIA